MGNSTNHMRNNRDDFSDKVKKLLCQRVGGFCSNPNCRQITEGAAGDGERAVSVGVAAHITAASKGGARFDNKLTSEQRKSIENGIWLCCNCHELIDRDRNTYTATLLKKWKNEAEKEAHERLENRNVGNIYLNNNKYNIVF